jgi:hypothetical protein
MAMVENSKNKPKRMSSIFPVEIGFVDRGANKLPVLVKKQQEANVVITKSAAVAALLVTAYDALTAEDQAAARTKITEATGLSSADLDAIMAGTTVLPDTAVAAFAEALGIASDDLSAAVSADAAAASQAATADTSKDASTPSAPASTPSTPAAPASGEPAPATPPAAPAAPADPASSVDAASTPTQKADDPPAAPAAPTPAPVVMSSVRPQVKADALLTLAAMEKHIAAVKASIAALPEDAINGEWSLPIPVASEVVPISQLAYVLEGCLPWDFTSLYKAENGKAASSKAGIVRKNADGSPQAPAVDMAAAIQRAVNAAGGPVVSLVRKSVADALAAFRQELERDAKPKSFGSSIAPSTQIPNEGATKPTTVLKSGTDIQK